MLKLVIYREGETLGLDPRCVFLHYFLEFVINFVHILILHLLFVLGE